MIQPIFASFSIYEETPYDNLYLKSNLPSAFLTLNANIPLTFPTRFFPSFFKASSIPSNITDEVNPSGLVL